MLQGGRDDGHKNSLSQASLGRMTHQVAFGARFVTSFFKASRLAVRSSSCYIQVDVDMGGADIAFPNGFQAAFNNAKSDTQLSQYKTGFDTGNKRLELIGVSQYVIATDAYLFEAHVQGLGTFQSGKFRAGVQGQSFAVATYGKHDITFFTYRCGNNGKVIFANIGNPWKRTANDIVVVLAYRSQMDFFDTRKVLDGVGHARAGE